MDCWSFWARRQYRSKAESGVSTFEEIYPRHEFGELVRLALAGGAWLAGLRQRVERRRSEVAASPLPGEITPAE